MQTQLSQLEISPSRGCINTAPEAVNSGVDNFKLQVFVQLIIGRKQRHENPP